MVILKLPLETRAWKIYLRIDLSYLGKNRWIYCTNKQLFNQKFIPLLQKLNTVGATGHRLGHQLHYSLNWPW